MFSLQHDKVDVHVMVDPEFSNLELSDMAMTALETDEYLYHADRRYQKGVSLGVKRLVNLTPYQGEIDKDENTRHENARAGLRSRIELSVEG